MKSGKWHMTDGMEQPNQDKIRMLGENETYKYLTSSNKWKWKTTFKKNILGELKKTTWDKTLMQKPHQRNKYLGCAPS